MRYLPTGFRLGLTLILVSRALVAHAQFSPPPLFRFDFTPLIGYRTNVTFYGTSEVEGVKPRLVLDPSLSYGFALGGRLNEEDVVEFRWARQSTHVRFDDGIVSPFRQKATLDQFQGDFTHEYFIDDWSDAVRPYVMASLGVTHISSLNSSITRFSFGLGAGMKFYVSRHLGFRVQGEWLPIVLNPQTTVFCGGGCTVHIRSQASSQGEFAIGPLLRF